MRILIISTFFPPLNSIASHRPHSFAKYWTEAGHDVTVLTTKKEIPSEEKLSLPNPGYEVIEVSLPSIYYKMKRSRKKNKNSSDTPSSSSFQKMRDKYGIFNSCRMPDFTDLWVYPAFKRIKNEEPWDVILSSSGPYTAHLVAYLLKKRNKASRWVADYRDPWCDSHSFPGLFPFTLIERSLERIILKQADLITPNGDALSRFYENKFNRPTMTVPNGFDPPNLLPDSEFPFPKDKKFRICYTGSVYEQQNPALLFQAIRQLRNDPLINKLEVRFYGYSNRLLSQLIKDHQVEKWVKICDPVSFLESVRIQKESDLLLFLPWNDPKRKEVLPAKIYEYLYSQTPIICIGAKSLDDSQKLIMEAKAGESFHNVETVVSFLKCQLCSEKRLKVNIDTKLLEKYHRKTIALKLLDRISL